VFFPGQISAKHNRTSLEHTTVQEISTPKIKRKWEDAEDEPLISAARERENLRTTAMPMNATRLLRESACSHMDKRTRALLPLTSDKSDESDEGPRRPQKRTRGNSQNKQSDRNRNKHGGEMVAMTYFLARNRFAGSMVRGMRTMRWSMGAHSVELVQTRLPYPRTQSDAGVPVKRQRCSQRWMRLLEKLSQEGLPRT
jgi:hypothetical protein